MCLSTSQLHRREMFPGMMQRVGVRAEVTLTPMWCQQHCDRGCSRTILGIRQSSGPIAVTSLHDVRFYTCYDLLVDGIHR